MWFLVISVRHVGRTMNTVSVYYRDKIIRLVLVWVTQANQTQRLFEVICEGLAIFPAIRRRIMKAT